MTDTDIVAAIRRLHLVGELDGRIVLDWDRATVDPGGSMFGAGPYLHVPATWGDDEAVVRVFAPERLRRRLSRAWERKP